MVIHTVERGDTLFSIARRYQVPVQQLIQYNGLQNADRLVVGQTIVILYPKNLYTVQAGDSLYGIAQKYKIPLNELYRNNPGSIERAYIYPGQQLVISFSQQKLGSMDVLGYAYPDVNRRLLKNTLPFMSYLMPFTYEIEEDGELSEMEDEELIEMAKETDVAPLMHLSNLREPIGFDSDLAHLVLTNRRIQERLIEETLETIQEKGYVGLDIDFENLYAADKKLFADFVGRMRGQLNPAGYEVFAALAAKTSDDQKGLLLEGHDYQAVGEAANGVLLMTYEWGYRYGPPMAVAPVGNVREVLDYAVTRIQPEKIFMGIPNYGYDWPLPYVQGVTAAKSISNVRAVQIAAEYGVQIEYSSTAQAPHFRYQDGSAEHEVWFEDAKSIRTKLELVAEYGLRGAGYWNLMRPFPENWSVLNALYRIEQLGF